MDAGNFEFFLRPEPGCKGGRAECHAGGEHRAAGDSDLIFHEFPLFFTRWIKLYGSPKIVSSNAAAQKLDNGCERPHSEATERGEKARYYWCCMTLKPPSIVRQVAFMKVHSSEIMKTAAMAISCGVAIRPPGCSFIVSALAFSGSGKLFQ